MSNEKMVTEVCQECGTENTFVWDVEDAGYEACCPHCGTVLMLCSECERPCDWKDGQGCKHSRQRPLVKRTGEKKIWGRIGMTFHLTEEEFHTLQEGGGDAAELIFQKVKSGEALLDGDTYFPSPEDGACSYDPRKYWEFSGDIELCL